MKTARNPPDVHAPVGAYSHQVEVSGDERWLVLSGQIGSSPDGSVPEDPMAQLSLALENIRRNLAFADMEIRDLVKLTVYLVGEWDTPRRRQLVSEWLGGHRPCMTLVYVAALAAPSYRVEIEAWASRPV